MVAMAKIAILLLVVFTVATLGNSQKVVFDHDEDQPYPPEESPSHGEDQPYPPPESGHDEDRPYPPPESGHDEDQPYPPPHAPAPAGGRHKSKVMCAMGCVIKCHDKKSWRKAVCIGVCLAGCAIAPTDSASEIACVVECAQSSTNNLLDEAKIDDRISACTQQCKQN